MYKLLIVDDSPVQIRMIKALIDWKSFGIYEIKVALNGHEGLELFKQYNADIVITDVVMPLLSGIKMTEEIKAIKPDVKFIYISCHDEFEFANDAIKNNVFAYLLKPVDAELLINSVTKIINSIENEKKQKETSKLLAEQTEAFKKNIIYTLIHSEASYIRETLDTALNLGYNKYNSFLIVSFELSDKEDSYSKALSVFNYFENNLFTDIDGYLFLQNKNSWFAIFMTDTDIDLKSEVKKLLISLYKNYPYSNENIVFAGISDLFSSLTEAKFMYTQTQGILENRMLGNEHNIFSADNFKHNPVYYNTSEIYDALSSLIENTYPGGIEMFMDKYYPENSELTFNYVKMLCTSIITILHLLMSERDMHLDKLFGNANKLWTELEGLNNALNVRSWIYEILSSVITYINDNEKTQYEKLVATIINEINENYNKISNTEELIANLYISASYAKSLFKKHTGKTIFDYLLKKRIDEAKKLLLQPDIKIYQVAEMVGYESRTHFSDIFKRYTGVTPKEYQQNHS